MTKFQLIVRGERAKHTRGDCIAIDLKAQTLEEAREEAKLHFYGNPAKWTVTWTKKQFGQGEDMNLYLNGDGSCDDLPYGVLMDHQEEPIHHAWIVETVEPFDAAALRQEIDTWATAQKVARDLDPKYQEFLRLQAEMKAKYGSAV